MIAPSLTARLSIPGHNSSTPSLLSRVESRVERQKRLARISTLNINLQLHRFKRKILVEPRRSGVVFQLLDLPLKIRVRHPTPSTITSH